MLANSFINKLLALPPGTVARLSAAWVVISWLLANFMIVPAIFIPLVGANPWLRHLLASHDTLTLLIIGFSYVPITLALICAVLVPYMRRRGWSLRELIGLKSLSPRWYDPFLAPPAYVVYFVLAIVMSGLVRVFLPHINMNEAQDFGIRSPHDLLSYGLVFLMLVVIPPLCEELLFRGFLLGTLLKGFPTVVAVLATSLLFGVAHGQANVFFDTFALSLVLCWLRLKTKSIWAGIFLHGLKNLIAFILLYVIGVQ